MGGQVLKLTEPGEWKSNADFHKRFSRIGRKAVITVAKDELKEYMIGEALPILKNQFFHVANVAPLEGAGGMAGMATTLGAAMRSARTRPAAVVLGAMLVCNKISKYHHENYSPRLYKADD